MARKINFDPEKRRASQQARRARERREKMGLDHGSMEWEVKGSVAKLAAKRAPDPAHSARSKAAFGAWRQRQREALEARIIAAGAERRSKWNRAPGKLKAGRTAPVTVMMLNAMQSGQWYRKTYLATALPDVPSSDIRNKICYHLARGRLERRPIAPGTAQFTHELYEYAVTRQGELWRAMKMKNPAS